MTPETPKLNESECAPGRHRQVSNTDLSGAVGCALELQNVGRTFGALVALHDVSFSVGIGERRAILGANGAGKTTLFNAITGDFPPSSGQIKLFGEEIGHIPVEQRVRRGLRRTYQKSLLFAGLSVQDNLCLAVRGVSDHRFSFRKPKLHNLRDAQALAKLVNLSHLLPTLVGELSHGEQRQLEIGMAMAGQPKLLLLDEPAAGLSPAERTLLTQVLSALPRSVTFIIIEHDLEIALKVADRVSIMNNGELFYEGTPAEVERNPDVQAIYLGKQTS